VLIKKVFFLIKQGVVFIHLQKKRKYVTCSQAGLSGCIASQAAINQQSNKGINTLWGERFSFGGNA
jgi:hypothetical protein